MPPLVSVLMPAYNCREYIASAIESCLAQTYGNFELIIVDDGSTDGTDAVIQGFLNNDHIKHIRQANAARCAACNTGIRLAQGSLIAFCDADDLLRHDKLEIQVEVMEKHPEIGLLHTARTAINAAGDNIGHHHARDTDISNVEIYDATRRLFHRNYICGPSAMIRRECFDEIGYFNESLRNNEDHELYLRLSTRYKFGYLNQELYKYRKHADQITNKRKELEFYKRHVLNIFLEQYPNAVSKRDMAIALANIHKARGHELLKNDKNPAAARGEFYRALAYRPINPSVWFRIVRSYLG